MRISKTRSVKILKMASIIADKAGGCHELTKIQARVPVLYDLVRMTPKQNSRPKMFWNTWFMQTRPHYLKGSTGNI